MLWYKSTLLHWSFLITFILLFTTVHCTTTTTDNIENDTRSNVNHSLSAEIHDYKSNDNITEINPIHEGFILLSDNQKKRIPSTITSISTTASTKTKQTSTLRTLSNTTTTTCKTKHHKTSTSTSKITTTTSTRSPNNTVKTADNHESHRRGRRLLNELSYDTDIDTSSVHASLDNNNDMDNFLKVDDEELTKQLVNLAVMADGSGFTTEEATEETSTSTLAIAVSSTGTITTETVSQESTETVTLTQLSTASTFSGITTSEELTEETTNSGTQVLIVRLYDPSEKHCLGI
ncbi:unnamed protein product [Adineta steineri]|uniref:Uncharacterized protein n=1 Tax=Adineta steineri TaxID=433720 RepID=A0A813SA25_9BILA|nr:unnamed protein product [Adineta steineri]